MPEETKQGTAVPEAKKEPVYTYNIPESIRELWRQRHGEEGPKTIGIVESTLERDLMGAKRANARGTSPTSETARMCLHYIDGKRTTDDRIDSFFAKAPKKLCELVDSAWFELNLPNKEETRDFLSSKSVSF